MARRAIPDVLHMVDGVRSLFLADAQEFVGKDVHLWVWENKSYRDAGVAHVTSLSYVKNQGPCLITDSGDFAIDHITSIRAA